MKKITPKSNKKPWIENKINPKHSDKKLSESEIKYTNFRLYLKILFGLIVLSIFTILAISRNYEDVVEYNAQGNPQLKPERLAKLADDIRRINNCQQYSLRATESDWYPCYSCGDTTMVYLLKGEIWKIGEKCDDNDARYSESKLKAMALKLYPEFFGDKTACYEEQQRKIYYYPLLPENQKRKKKLGHPPGNKQDN